MQRKWKNIHNNSLFPLKLKGNENQIAWDCYSDRWGIGFFVVVGGKCRRSNRSTRQPQCLPVCRWTGCPHCAPEGNLSWQCVRLQVEPGKSGTSASCCWRKERESTSERVSWMLNVLFVLFYLRNVRFVAIPPFSGLELWPLIWDQAPFSC